MLRWIRVLEAPLPKRRRARETQPPVKLARTPAVGSTASKAFWMMHAEAQRGSGLNATEYANAHRLPVRRMRRESRRFREAPQAQSWRDLMHPAHRAPMVPGRI